VVCWLAPVAALIGWHVPAVFELGVRSRWWHDLQAASFFATGVLFWLPVVRWRAGVVSASPWLVPVYLFAATLPCDALSAFLCILRSRRIPSYLSAPRLKEYVPSDQEFAGALMWVSVTLIYPCGRSDHARALRRPGRIWIGRRAAGLSSGRQEVD
jgi:cytochrome c oxidase assembly factor CtaG